MSQNGLEKLHIFGAEPRSHMKLIAALSGHTAARGSQFMHVLGYTLKLRRNSTIGAQSDEFESRVTCVLTLGPHTVFRSDDPVHRPGKCES